MSYAPGLKGQKREMVFFTFVLSGENKKLKVAVIWSNLTQIGQ